LALLVFGGCVAQPVLADAQQSVELLGGKDSRPIQLSPTKQVDGSLSLKGHLDLAFSNRTGSTQPVRILYTASDSTATRSVGYLALRRHATDVVQPSFELGQGEAPKSLDGTLLVKVGPRNNPSEQFSVPVTGAVASFGDVHFEPNKLVIHATRWCLGCNITAGGNVRLYGDDVGRLLSYRAAGGETASEVNLYSAGRSVRVQLKNLRPDPADPRVLLGTVSLLGRPPPGKYSGTVQLSSLVPGAPGLPIEAVSRIWVLWAILAILLGVALGGLLYQFLGLWRRKRLLSGALEYVVDDYARHRGLNELRGAPGQRQLIWDLKIKHPLVRNKAWKYWEELDSSSNIYTAIYWARNEGELDEAQAATLTLVHAIKTWLLALTEVRGLWELRNAHHDPDTEDEWGKTVVMKDTELLLVRARRTPGDELLSSKLVALAAQQTSWHRLFAQAWDLKERLIKFGVHAGAQAAKVKLIELDTGSKSVLERTEDEQDELDRCLSLLYRKLVQIRTEHAPAVALEVPSTEKEEQSAARRSELKSLHTSPRAEVALANLQATTITALAPVTGGPEKTPEPSPAPPPSTASAAPSPRERTLSDADEAPPGHKFQRLWTRAGQSTFLRWLRALDLLASFAILLITSILYVATIYTDTWGTVGDFASAIGAGFLGQVVVKWALLPVSRSVRLGSASAAPPAGEASTSS
jgi:hypothetical protein